MVNLILTMDGNRDACVACAKTLSNLSAQGKTASSLGLLLFLTTIAQCGPLIGLAIPVILNLLNEGCYSGGFLKLWEQGMSSIYPV